MASILSQPQRVQDKKNIPVFEGYLYQFYWSKSWSCFPLPSINSWMLSKRRHHNMKMSCVSLLKPATACQDLPSVKNMQFAFHRLIPTKSRSRDISSWDIFHKVTQTKIPKVINKIIIVYLNEPRWNSMIFILNWCTYNNTVGNIWRFVCFN